MNEVLKLSPETQESFMQMQAFQQQMQQINMQKETLKFQKVEAENAINELKNLKDDSEVFKAVGPILIKSTKSDLEKELKEKMETVEVRMKTIEKQENKIKEKVQKVQEKLQELLKPAEKTKQSAG